MGLAALDTLRCLALDDLLAMSGRSTPGEVVQMTEKTGYLGLANTIIHYYRNEQPEECGTRRSFPEVNVQ
jgi:hypothetical protein